MRESAFDTLANLTKSYTLTEIDFVVRRAFLSSVNQEGARDPVQLHHFEKIIADTPSGSGKAFSFAPSRRAEEAVEVAGEEDAPKEKKPKKKKDVKDPMDSIFGWCNFWLPEQFHLPPVVWAMVVFAILAHLMARSTYPSHSPGNRRRRGGASSLFNDPSLGGRGMGGMGGMGGFGGLGDDLGGFGTDPLRGPSPFSGGFPAPPGMPGLSNPGGIPSFLGSQGEGSTAPAATEGSSAPAEAKVEG